MASWISMDEACRLLRVRPQTVYAYVRRGKLEVMSDPADTRAPDARAASRGPESRGTAGDDKVVAHYLSNGLPLAGFGHHFYPMAIRARPRC